MLKSKVLFILTGSIACYKACQVISRLVQHGCEVQVVATPSALEFVGNATIEGLTGKHVVSDLFAAGDVMDHIYLARWADLILVAPATANFINKAAQGVADDLVQTLFLAHDFKKPFLVAPAMNTTMYLHPITKESTRKLQNMGIKVLETASGVLACGEEGLGKLLDPDLILKEVIDLLPSRVSFAQSQNKPLKVLVTAGGTQEPIDTVRVISNLSSGKTGVVISEVLTHQGCDVTLLQAHSSQVPSSQLKVLRFTSFADLNEKLENELKNNSYDMIVHAAAVSDYSVESVEVQGKKYSPLTIPKVSSSEEHMSIHLKRNFKIINRLKDYSQNKDIDVIAFKLTSHASSEDRQLAVQKLFSEAHVDAVVHNDLTEIDIAKGLHRFTVHSQGMEKSIEGPERLALALIERKLVRKNK